MRKPFKKCYLIISLFLFFSPVYSAQQVNLSKHDIAYLAPYFKDDKTPEISALTLSLKKRSNLNNKRAQAAKGSKLVSVQSHTDFNGTAHYRFNQTYLGYSVWGVQAVLHSHSPTHITMNGTIYENLAQDLGTRPPFSKLHKEEIIAHLLPGKTVNYSQPIVYIDKNAKAHWAYLLIYSVSKPTKQMNLVVDASTESVLQRWNNLQTDLSSWFNPKKNKEPPPPAPIFQQVLASGYGGNIVTGEYVFGEADFPKLLVSRNIPKGLCFLENSDVAVHNAKQNNALYEFSCRDNPNHIYHNDYDKVNGAFSPSNDAFYAGEVIKKLYREWYGIRALKNRNGSPMLIKMLVHFGHHYENAYWDSYRSTMVFGDGGKHFYPLTSVGIVAHEVSHGFTQQHANLIYLNQSGALNESFSDMAAQAAEYYAFGKSSWLIGERIAKEKPMRYLYEPSLDGISIGTARKYKQFVALVRQYFDDPVDQQDIIVHCASGVFNKFFYLLATSQNWDTKKAFGVMVKANQDYWTPRATFQSAACGVIHAAKDYQKQDANYDLSSVRNAFSGVGINTANCKS